MAMIGVRELRNRTADIVARARAGEDIVVTSHGIPSVRLEPVDPHVRPYLTKAELLRFPQADAGMRDELRDLGGETTDDLGPIQ